MALELSFQAYGTTQDDHPPLLILHGLFGASGNWRSIAKPLARNRRVFCLDARNHGGSPHAMSMDYPTLSHDVVDFAAYNGLSHVDVLGHSMGGKTAMVLALTHATLVRRLLVADIAPVVNPHSFRSLIQAMRAVDLRGISKRSDADEQLKAQIPEAELRQFLLQNLVREVDSLRWRINIDAIDNNLAHLLAFDPLWASVPYHGPTLFLRGANSQYVRDEHHSTIHAYFPNARIVTVANAGHWLHAENPEAFIHEVSHFLDG